MTLYEERLRNLEQFIRLKAPARIIYFSCETLLLCAYKSRLGIAWHFIKSDIHWHWVNLALRIEFTYLRLRYGKEKAIERFCEK